MTNHLPRRLFLKALAAAPAIAQKVAEEAVGATTAAAETSGVLGGVPSALPMHGKALELAGLAKAGLLPEWVKRLAVRNVRYDRRLDPDVACLQSVSLSAKIAISHDRRLAREWANFERDALDQKLMAEFMGWPT